MDPESSGTRTNGSQQDLSAAESVLCGHSQQELKLILSDVATSWHLFAAGTNQAWRTAYNSVDKTRRTSAGAALASASTTQWAMESGLQDIHKFVKPHCQWQYIRRHLSCAYSSSNCRAMRPEQTLKLCQRKLCRHRLSLSECLVLAAVYGSASFWIELDSWS